MTMTMLSRAQHSSSFSFSHTHTHTYITHKQSAYVSFASRSVMQNYLKMQSNRWSWFFSFQRHWKILSQDDEKTEKNNWIEINKNSRHFHSSIFNLPENRWNLFPKIHKIIPRYDFKSINRWQWRDFLLPPGINGTKKKQKKTPTNEWYLRKWSDAWLTNFYFNLTIELFIDQQFLYLLLLLFQARIEGYFTENPWDFKINYEFSKKKNKKIHFFPPQIIDN